MQFINSTDIKSKLGIGSAQFGLHYGISNTIGQTSVEEVSLILKFASENGISLIDTASAYGNAEIVLGENNLSDFKIVSKFMNSDLGENILVRLSKTLYDLKLNSIYAYLAHRPLELINHPWQWEEMDDFKSSGLIQKRGFSLNDPNELEMLLEKGFIPEIIQVPYNYFDRRFEPLMRTLKGNGCEIHTRSTFLQGLFFKKAESLPGFFEEIKPILSSFELLKFPIGGALLRFVLEKDFIDKVIIGVENINQLVNNVVNLKSEGDLPTLKKAIANSILTPSSWPK